MYDADREALQAKAVEEIREHNREVLFPISLHDLFGVLTYTHMLMRIVGHKDGTPQHLIKFAREAEKFYKGLPACMALIDDGWDKSIDAMIEAESEPEEMLLDKIQEHMGRAYTKLSSLEAKYKTYVKPVMMVVRDSEYYQVQVWITKDLDLQLAPGVIFVVNDENKGRTL